MKHSKHEWYLRHSINEALRNRASTVLALCAMREELRKGLSSTDPIVRAVQESSLDELQVRTATDSGCSDDVPIVFMLTKRE